MGCQTSRTGLHLRPLHDPGEELLVLGPDHGGGVPPAEGHAARPRPRPRLPPQHHQLQLRAQLQAGALRGEDLDPDNVYPIVLPGSRGPYKLSVSTLDGGHGVTASTCRAPLLLMWGRSQRYWAEARLSSCNTQYRPVAKYRLLSRKVPISSIGISLRNLCPKVYIKSD